MIQSETIPGYVHAQPVKQTNAYKLFNYRFLVEIAQMHLYDSKWLESSGVVTTGNPVLDRQTALQPMVAQLSPAAMAEFHDEGVEMRLVNPEDSVRIYQMIYDHMKDWQHAVNFNVNINDAPLEDLRKFDALATEVYKLARYYWKEKPYHGQFGQFLQSRGRRRTFLDGTSNPEAINKPDHTPMADSIAKTLGDRKKPWKAGG